MATRNNKKLALSVLGLGAATAAVVFGSWASWTAQTTNPGNKVTAGTLTMTNDKAATKLFDVTDIKPGASGDEDVVIGAGTGSEDLKVTLSADVTTDFYNDAGIDGDTENLLQVQIYDSTESRCVYPNDADGACSTWGNWTHDDLGAFSLQLKDSAGDPLALTAGSPHTFNVAWQFTNGGSEDNDSQGETAEFGLTWDGVVA
jgi:hypothetical protein